MLHILAGVILIVQAALIWSLNKTFHNVVIDVLAYVTWLTAIVFLFLSMRVLRREGSVEAGKSYTETITLAQGSLYGLTRHPQYFGWALMYVAGFLFNPRWPLAVLGIAGIVCVYLFTLREERLLVDKFGEAYVRYMEVVPRFNILLGIIRRFQKRAG